jgi:hypothetical protein
VIDTARRTALACHFLYRDRRLDAVDQDGSKQPDWDNFRFRGLGIVASVAVMGCACALPAQAQQEGSPVVI